MHYIRTAEAMVRVLDTPLEPELHTILSEHRERLAGYYDFRFEELAEFLIVERGDTLADSEDSYRDRSMLQESSPLTSAAAPGPAATTRIDGCFHLPTN